MGQTLSEFSVLKSLRKELEAKEQTPAPEKPAVPKRDRTIAHPSREEAQAKSTGIVRGQRVRMVDSEEAGKIVGFGKDFYEMESDEGYVLKVRREEFVLVDSADDRALYCSVPSSQNKRKDERSVLSRSDEMTVDLHFDRILGNERIAGWAALEFQIDYFRSVLRSNLKYKGKRIVFIHGDGDGTLRNAIRKELDETFALSCSYQPARPELYGTGATMVTIR